ncbi:hypothetical protein H6F68_05025 [Trichocoleus sp. FACHB-262]|nr:hypothetical protein [Trichocoleus sp. FACHB-262]
MPWWLSREELRLDVDGRYPQMIASGTVFRSLSTRIHWIANLMAMSANTWRGAIWYKDGDAASLPYTNVEIEVVRSRYPNQRSATVTFTGNGAPDRVRTFRYKSAYFHEVEFEFDAVEGTTAATSINTFDHPNRPATLPNETVTIQDVFGRAGFRVRTSNGGNAVPLNGAGWDRRWSNSEMHDAMQTYWSRYADGPQWAMWVFFAAIHEEGESLGGIMFDDIGPNHRQGTAIFNDTFIADPPPGDPAPQSWVQRMRFWTACHEMGHAFNLAHSWQKQHSPEWGKAWIPLANEPEARSFMNYPFNVAGGQTAFFRDFEYRFSDGELLFMRHAPAKFVQMGNANWFDDHGFEQAVVSPEPDLKLELRTNRQKNIFEFLEPVVLELKLTNISNQPQLIHNNILSQLDHMTVIIKKKGKAARQFIPFAQYCWKTDVKALMPGESMYDSLFVSVGQNGWDLSEPGYYTVQIALHMDEEPGEEDVVSNPLVIRIAPPRGYDEEFIAQDFFSKEVGRILTFDGSRFLDKGNDILHEVTERLSDRRVAIHAHVALASALSQDYKQLEIKDDQLQIQVAPAKVEEARQKFAAALTDEKQTAAESLGHIDYKYYVDRFSDWLAQQGDPQAAAETQNELLQVLRDRNVIQRVLETVKDKRDEYQQQK